MCTFRFSLHHVLQVMEITTLLCDSSELAVSTWLYGYFDGMPHVQHIFYPWLFGLAQTVSSLFSGDLRQVLFLGPSQMLSETSQG